MSKAHALMSFLLAMGACKSEPPAPGSQVCDALALATETSRVLRDEATGQYTSGVHAMEKWAKWNAGTVTPEQNGTGAYSEAGAMALQYKAAGHALCLSSTLVNTQMVEIARLIEPADELRAAAAHLPTGTECIFDENPIDPEPKKRELWSAQWTRQLQSARGAEDAVVEACYRSLGGARRAFQLPAFLMMTE